MIIKLCDDYFSRSKRTGQQRPAAFFDRDGVINVDHGYVHRAEAFEFVEGAIEAIRLCNAAGYFVFVVTNQSGIARGYYEVADVELLHAHLRDALAASGAYVDDVRYCPHHPEATIAAYRADCSWRKPGPGMIKDLMKSWPVDAAKSFLIGDNKSDLDAASAAGIQGHLFSGKSLKVLVENILSAQNNVARIKTWLAQQALPVWCSQGLRAQGEFAERITVGGGGDEQVPLRVLVQARQIYVYSHASIIGLAPDGVTYARRAFSYVMERAALEGGGFCYSLTSEGHVFDETRDTYTHAFLLFAASWLFKATGDQGVLHQLEVISDAIDALRDPDGRGYIEDTRGSDIRRQNPHMHLFEAFLAAFAATGDRKFLNRATEIHSLFKNFFYDPGTGTIGEFFAPDLSPVRHPQGVVVEAGHHYEWVWLLGEFAHATGEKISSEIKELYRFALANGVEQNTNLIYNQNWSDGSIKDFGKRAWPQAEAIKAAITMAELGGDTLAPQADLNIDNLFQYFLSRPVPGVWLDTLSADNKPAVSSSAASNFYHVFLAFAEYMRFFDKQ